MQLVCESLCCCFCVFSAVNDADHDHANVAACAACLFGGGGGGGLIFVCFLFLFFAVGDDDCILFFAVGDDGNHDYVLDTASISCK